MATPESKITLSNLRRPYHGGSVNFTHVQSAVTDTQLITSNGMIKLQPTAAGGAEVEGRLTSNDAAIVRPQSAKSMGDGHETLTTAELFIGYAQEGTGLTGGGNLTTPSAADIVGDSSDPTVGTSFVFGVDNRGGGANARTLVGGANVTVQGTAAVAGGDVGWFRVVYTNIGTPEVFFIRLD